MVLALILFILTYVGLLALPQKRAWVALISALLFILLGILPVGDVLGSVDFNVLMMIAGTMGIVSLFIESKMPSLLADLILERTPNVKWAVVFLALFAGGVLPSSLDQVDWIAAGIFVGCLVVLRRWKTDPIAVMAGAGVAGWILYSIF